MKIAVVSLVLSLSLAAPLMADEHLGQQPSWDHSQIDSTIYGGAEAETCQWPTTVMLYDGAGLCTGTLVHPEIVIYAAHCGTSFSQVNFGESFERIRRQVDVDHCERFTETSSVGPKDYAYCKLSKPVTDIAITPVAYGCEVDELVSDRDVVIAGFGQDNAGNAGTKHWAGTKIHLPLGDMISVGGSDISAWQGDSGGPAFIQLDDRSWRAFGIVSGGSGPGQPVAYVRMDRVVQWVEESSGVDITPCHTVDGQWSPTAECGGFATNPAAGGNWADGCNAAPVVEYSRTCGQGFVIDEAPPTVRFVSPEPGADFGGKSAQVFFEVEAVDDSAGVKRVWLEAPGVDGWELRDPPYLFEATFPAGDYEIKAYAEDMAGNVSSAESLKLTIGEGGCSVGRRGGGSSLVILLAGMLLFGRRRRTSS